MIQSNKFITITPKSNYRLIAISDIHGGLHLLKELLQKAELGAEDYLVLIGDSIEKGPYNIEMLQYLKELSKRPNTFILSGNWEAYMISRLILPENAEDLLDYIQSVKYTSFITAWCEKLGIDVHSITNPQALQERLKESFAEDIDFLSSFPLALEFDDFIFVHAGVEPIENWRESKRAVLLTCKEFFYQSHCCDKYVVVGHWAAVNYRKQSMSNDIVIDHDKKIISIDGGYGVKTTGQLNALIVEKLDRGYKFSSQFADDYTEYRVVKPQVPLDGPIVKIEWRDCAIEVLEGGRQFSLCKKVSTGEKLYIKNEFIVQCEDEYICNDEYVSLFLEAEAGDIVRVQDFYGEYAFARYGDELGWIHRDVLKVVE